MLSLKINIRQISSQSQLLIRKILLFIHCLMCIYHILHLTSAEKKQKHTSKVIFNVSDSSLSFTIIFIIKKSKTSKSIRKNKKRKSTAASSITKRGSIIKMSSIIKRGSITKENSTIRRSSIIKRDKIRSNK